MVRIVEEQPDPSVVKHVVCGNCGRKLEYVPADVKKDYSSDYLGGKDYYNYIRCPGCNKRVHV